MSIERSLIVIGGITVLFTILFVVVNLLVRRLIIEPIIEVTTVAKAVSHGDVSQEVILQKRNDEISDLAHSFELMRRSLVMAMKRIKRKS